MVHCTIHVHIYFLINPHYIFDNKWFILYQKLLKRFILLFFFLAKHFIISLINRSRFCWNTPFLLSEKCRLLQTPPKSNFSIPYTVFSLTNNNQFISYNKFFLFFIFLLIILLSFSFNRQISFVFGW